MQNTCNTKKMETQQPTYMLKREGKLIPVFVIPPKEPPCRQRLIEKYRDQINKNKVEINPADFYNWNDTAVYC